MVMNARVAGDVTRRIQGELLDPGYRVGEGTAFGSELGCESSRQSGYRCCGVR